MMKASNKRARALTFAAFITTATTLAVVRRLRFGCLPNALDLQFQRLQSPPLPTVHAPLTASCQQDNEGSWSIGIFKGPNPFNLTPIEQLRTPNSQQWPLGNPVITCASVLDVPSNFVADPFLHQHTDGALYVFFETKSNSNNQGDIAAARSSDGGASWHYLGIALDEPWHLSYPFVFTWEDEVYMLPEGFRSGGLRLYRASSFPLVWEFHSVLLRRRMIDTSLVEWNDSWWMFSSDRESSSDLEIFYSSSPLGPWKPHSLNPVQQGKNTGARMGGRFVKFEGRLFRFGQDCGTTYGRQIIAYRIDILSPTRFSQTRVNFTFSRTAQGLAAWNAERHHHIDAQQMPDGTWLAVMDGDWQPKPDQVQAY